MMKKALILASLSLASIAQAGTNIIGEWNASQNGGSGDYHCESGSVTKEYKAMSTNLKIVNAGGKTIVNFFAKNIKADGSAETIALKLLVKSSNDVVKGDAIKTELQSMQFNGGTVIDANGIVGSVAYGLAVAFKGKDFAESIFSPQLKIMDAGANMVALQLKENLACSPKSPVTMNFTRQ